MGNHDRELERLSNIVRMIRPLPDDVRPSERFVRETRRMLEQPEPPSLAEYRRRWATGHLGEDDQRPAA